MANGVLPIPVAKERLTALAQALQQQVGKLTPGGELGEVMTNLKAMQDLLKHLPWSYEGAKNLVAAEEARTMGWTVANLLMDCVCTDKEHAKSATGSKAAGPSYITTGTGRDAALARLKGIERSLAKLP